MNAASELLDAVSRTHELIETAATQSQTGQRVRDTTYEMAAREAGRAIAALLQEQTKVEAAIARGKTRALPPQLYAACEAALHAKQLVEKQIREGPGYEPLNIPVNLSELADAQLRHIAARLDETAGNPADALRVDFAVAAACVRAYLAERIAQREEGHG